MMPLAQQSPTCPWEKVGSGASFSFYVVPSQLEFFGVSEGIVPAFRFTGAHK